MRPGRRGTKRSRITRGMEAQSSSRADKALALADPISPELVLVTPELRVLAVRELWEDDGALTFAARLSEVAAPATPEVGLSDGVAARRLLAQIILYAAWQAVTGAPFG